MSRRRGEARGIDDFGEYSHSDETIHVLRSLC
jgi:hypothetical protein